MRIEQYATTAAGSTLVSTERYYYDSANRATRIIRQDADNDTYECRWEYDHNNNVTNLVEIVNGQTHTSAYTYDLEQRISQFVNDGVTSGYTYDGFGRLETASNGILSRSYGYKVIDDDYNTGQVAALTLDAANYDRTYTYTYDANGNILSVSDGTNTTSYVYDSLNQLVREKNQAAGKTWVYTYDNGGNITSRKEYDNATGALVSQAQYTYGDTHWGDLLTAYKGQSITYDGIGNPSSDGEWEYTWENGRQLAAMESDTAEWTFKYNADGLRTERSNGTVTYDYIYSGSQLIQMTVGTDTLYFTYDASGTPMAVDFNGTKYFYATNLQGDIIAILDTNGNAVVEYTYDAWGNHLSTTGTMANTLGAVNPLRYRGYVYDQETQLYYLQSRYYDPELGRFINADAFASTGQGILGNNMFAYCLNNPIRYEDTQGSKAEEAEDDEDDEYETIGFGVQISGAASCGIAAGGGGIEIIIFLDFPGAQANGDPVVAIYAYGEVDGIIDIECIEELVELLLECADLMKIDGVNTLTAILANYHLEFAVTPFVVEANSGFCGVNDYTEFFQNKAITVGSFTYSTAWSDTCRTKGIGYTYIPGKPLLRLEFPTVSRGTSFYRLIWSSVE